MRCTLIATALLLVLAVPGSARAVAQLPNPCTLLMDSEVSAAVGGAATHAESGTRLYHVCTWSGPPQGYAQTSQQMSIQVGRVTKAQFLDEMRHSTPTPAPVPAGGRGILAFVDNGGLYVWQGGDELELDGPYLTVYPLKGLALAKLALKRLR
jgi:hypothetical protein